MNTVEGLQVTRYVRKCYTGDGYEWAIIRDKDGKEMLHGHCAAEDIPPEVLSSQRIQHPGAVWPL